jgi:DNA polymerase-3 subunit beta
MIKFKIKAGKLANSLSSLMPIVPAKPNRDTLKNVKLSVNKNLTLMVSDAEIYAQLVIDGSNITVLKEGEILVPAQAFLDFIKSFGSDNDISIEHDDDNSAVLKIECDGSKFEIGIQDLDEFPHFPEIPDNAEKFEISAEEFARLINKSEFAAADKNNPRLELNAVCILCSNDDISLMATDTKRMAIASSKLKNPVMEDRKLLVTPRALAQITKMATTGDVNLLVSSSTLFVKSEFSCLSVQLIDAKFPPINDLIPNYSKSIKLQTTDFMNHLKQAFLAADSKNTVRFRIKENEIVLSARIREQNKNATVKYKCEYKEEPVEVAFDGKFLLDALKAAETSEILFSFEESDQPLYFTEPGFQYILAVQE